MPCPEPRPKREHCYKEFSFSFFPFLLLLCPFEQKGGCEEILQLFFFKVPQLISGPLAEICLQQFIMARNFYPSCNSSWCIFFSQPPPTSKRGPCQCQLDCNSRRDVGGGCVCVCLCVSVCGLCRFGPEPSPWHICVDKHIFTHLLPLDAVAFRGRCWESEEVWCVKGSYLPHTDLWLSTTHFPHGALMYLELFWVRLRTFSTFIWFAEGTVRPCFYPERCCFRCQTRKMGLFDLKKREWRSDPLIHSLPDSHGFGGIRRRHVQLSEDSWCLPSICRSSWDSKWWPNMLIKNGKLGRLAF